MSELLPKFPALSLSELCRLIDMDYLIPTSAGPIRRYRKVLGAPVVREAIQRDLPKTELEEPRLVSSEKLNVPAVSVYEDIPTNEVPTIVTAPIATQSTVTPVAAVFPNLTPRPAPLRAVKLSVPTPTLTMAPTSRGASVVARLAPISGGVNVKIGDSLTRITVPAMNSRQDCLEVLKGLLEAYDASPHRADWILDLTAIDFIPNMLMGALVTYQKTLSKRGRKMDILISRHCSESKSFAAEITAHLDVQVIDQGDSDTALLVGRRA